jgi:hypothetical protein
MTMLTSQYGCTTGTGNGIATVIILHYLQIIRAQETLVY